MGTDSHGPSQLAFMDFGIAAISLAGIDPGRILNFLSHDQLQNWPSDTSLVPHDIAWVECRGKSANRRQFSALFKVLRNTRGSYLPHESLLPDFRGMFLRGVNNGRQAPRTTTSRHMAAMKTVQRASLLDLRPKICRTIPGLLGQKEIKLGPFRHTRSWLPATRTKSKS